MHAGKRDLHSGPRATYHMAPHLVEPLRTVAKGFSQMHGGDEEFSDLRIKPVQIGDTVSVSSITSIE